jgi:hypothetical protein
MVEETILVCTSWTIRTKAKQQKKNHLPSLFGANRVNSPGFWRWISNPTASAASMRVEKSSGRDCKISHVVLGSIVDLELGAADTVELDVLVLVGDWVGTLVEAVTGLALGDCVEGSVLGSIIVGLKLGLFGAMVVGAVVAYALGSIVSTVLLGLKVGLLVGSLVGALVGTLVGEITGALVGFIEVVRIRSQWFTSSDNILPSSISSRSMSLTSIKDFLWWRWFRILPWAAKTCREDQFSSKLVKRIRPNADGTVNCIVD